jgi:hypothetical protein
MNEETTETVGWDSSSESASAEAAAAAAAVRTELSSKAPGGSESKRLVRRLR